LNLWTDGNFEMLSNLVAPGFLKNLQKAYDQYKQDGLSFSTSLQTVHEANIERIITFIEDEKKFCIDVALHIYSTKLDFNEENKVRKNIFTTESEILTFRGYFPDIKWKLVNLESI